MAKGSKSSKGSPDKKSKDSKKKSPDKKSKKSPKDEVPPSPPYEPIRAVELHPNISVKTDGNLYWLTGPGFTVIVNKCYTREELLLFRNFFNLPVWDFLTLDETLDAYCRECIHGNCKNWPGTTVEDDGKGEVMREMEAHWNLELPAWDRLYVDSHLDEYDRECCAHRGGTNLRSVDLASIPKGPRYVNTQNLRARPPTILKPLPPRNLGVGYTYLRNLGLRDEYNDAIVKEIQKTYLELKMVPSVTTTMIKRGTGKIRLGLVISVTPGPNVFVIYVVKNTPAWGARLEFGDQILDVDGLPMNSKLALSRLTENKSIVINVMYTKCPFKLYFSFQVPKGDCMGFKLVDGNIVFVEEQSAAHRAQLPLNYQIVELDRECVVGLTNRELKRDIRNRASEHSQRLVSVTVVPRRVFDALSGRLDTRYIRNRALSETTATSSFIF